MATNSSSGRKSATDLIDRIIELFEERGNSLYGGEAVSQTEHALQAALAAENEGAEPALVAAALLHDLGHLLHHLPEDSAEHGIDDHHEDLACRWLERHFGPEVTEPIRLHVAAKRYLCAEEPGYHEALSDASRLSLEIQGGPFSPEEAEELRDHPQGPSAIRLRRWDDLAKVVGLKTPDLAHYRPILLAAAR